jgi:hypothetical protein
MRRKIAKRVLVAVFAGLLVGCGASSKHGSTTASSASEHAGSAIDRVVESEVRKHLEILNPGVKLKAPSCEERGPVPSMGEDALAFLCTFDGETAHAELWAELPMDHEEPVQPLDLTAERELAARGEVAGLNDGHSEADNRSAEEDIRHAEETSSQQTTSEAPATTSSVTACGVLKYSGAHWSLGEQWRITDSATPCPEALRVIREDFSGNGTNHPGADNAESYTTVNGWRCFGPETGSIDCTRGTQRITGSELRGTGGGSGE